MNTENLLNYLKQYFNYIRKVFLDEYSQYLDYEKIDKINNLNDIFKIDPEAQFKVYFSDKINICLNVTDFINANNLNNDANLKEIDINAKIYIKYLKDHQNDVERLVLSVILKPIINYLINPEKDVISLGVVDLITENISEKYQIKYMHPYSSKEADIVKLLAQIMDEQIIYKSVLNKQLDILNNQVLYDTELSSILKPLNDKYNNYAKRVGKVYYDESLYDYQQLNYQKDIEKLLYLIENKDQSNNTRKARVVSSLQCINNLKKHAFLFDNNEQQQINNVLLKIEKLNELEKINDENYEYLINLENYLMPIINKTWRHQLTDVIDFSDKVEFGFLVGNANQSVVEAKFLTDRHLRNMSNNLKYNYGYIYQVADNIIYSTSNDILITKTVSDNENTITFKDIKIDIDNQKDSKLLTPDLLLQNDLRNKHNGSVILYNPKVVGVFAIYNNELSSDYEKARELCNNLDLPFIKINKNIYETRIIKEKQKKVEVKPTVQRKKEIIARPKFKERLRSLKDNILYEEEYIENKKVA